MATTASAQSVQVAKPKGKGAYVYSDTPDGNENQAAGNYSTVSGGFFNEATNEYSTIGGGDSNTATGKHSTIGGGFFNEANGNSSTIAGGRNNQATGNNSTVAGGSYNQATGNNSTVAGGYNNTATGRDSTIAGGRGNQATGAGSFAAGVGNQANTDNAVALGKNNIINGNNSAAIGSNNNIGRGKENVFILGSGTTDVTSNSVLLGDKTAGKEATTVREATVNGLTLGNFAGASQAENGVVSVGHVGGERQIVNVGAGGISATSTDAVNGSQLHALATAVDAEFKNLTENQNYLLEQDEAINRELESLADSANAQDEKILKNQTAIEQNLNRTVTNGFEIEKNKAGIAKNQADIQALENDIGKELLNLSGRLLDQKADIDNNINNIYELAQQQDQHSSDIKTLKKNVEEGLLELSGHLIDQKADIAQNQTDIEDLAAYNELQDRMPNSKPKQLTL
ncbi:hypothetical protein D6D60_06320 [Moraxella catarrhalis]|nr:hypothetical protein D6D60_06320 [Moraxella catarrhalis]